MADNKQEWVYGEDGPSLKKSSRMPKLKKMHPWYLGIPWVVVAVLILSLFAMESTLSTFLGIVLLIVAPLLALAVNAATIYWLKVRPLRKAMDQHFKKRITRK